MIEHGRIAGWADLCGAVEAGSLAPEVAASHALGAGGSVEEAIGLIDAGELRAGASARAAIVSALRDNRSKCDAMAAWYKRHGSLPPAGLDSETLDATASFFDEALRMSPQASVAPHSLGSAAVLQRATDEIVQYLLHGKFLGQRRKTLELGCGNGRIPSGIAPYVLEAAGVDVSGEMIAAANRRRKGLSGVRFFHTPAHRLEALRDRDYNLVFAVDSFPHIVNAGAQLVRQTLAETRRVLRDDGDVLILKYSARNDEASDR